MGYTGGGNYVKLYGGQSTSAEGEAAPAETAAKPETAAETAAKVTAAVEKLSEATAPVAFSDITMFIDTKVSSDLEYKYRVRFWAAEAGGAPTGSMRQSAYAPVTAAVSPKPDTEFYLASVLADQGRASIVVRKWTPVSNKWSVQTYLVAPGEQIGRVEYRAKTDTGGMPVLDAAGKLQMEAVDFSTACVLLDARYQPRSFEQRGTPSRINPLTGERLSVDNVQYVLYDTPQIVYSDRKGTLRVKWQSSAELS
jgi:hypothetical protein